MNRQVMKRKKSSSQSIRKEQFQVKDLLFLIARHWYTLCDTRLHINTNAGTNNFLSNDVLSKEREGEKTDRWRVSNALCCRSSVITLAVAFDRVELAHLSSARNDLFPTRCLINHDGMNDEISCVRVHLVIEWSISIWTYCVLIGEK